MNITFETAIAQTESLLNRSDLSPQQLGEEIASLITTESGARGFFVTFLTGDWELADRPTSYLLQVLRDFPQPAAELLVKNLAMSTAMAITHRCNHQLDLARSSDRVQQRSRLLIQLVNSPELQSIVLGMLKGDYELFLQKWGYDAHQRQAITEQLQACLKEPV